MADIDQILAGGAGASTRADFSGLANLPELYWKGRDRAFAQEGRDLFRGGIPKNADGTIDYAAMRNALFQHGDLAQGVALDNLDVQRQGLKLGQEAAAKMGSLEMPGAPAPIVSPPSTNRSAETPVAPPLNKGGEVRDGSQGGATLMKVVAASGIPNDQLGAATASIGRQLGVDDPNSPIDLNDPRVRNVLVPAIQQLKRMGIGEVAQAGQPQQQPIPPVNPQQNQGTFGAPPATPTRGAVPTGNDPEIQKQIAYYTHIASNPVYPKSVQEAAMTRLKALQEQGAPTPDIKNYEMYRRQGGELPMKDWETERESSKAAASERAKGDFKEQQDYIDRGRSASRQLSTLNTITNIVNSDKNLTLGYGGPMALKIKMALQQAGMDFGDLSGAETIQKLNAVLASEAIKSVSPRPTQFEFKTFLENNPGLNLDEKGNIRMLGILSQTAKRDYDLGKLARSNRDNWEKWDDVVEKYDRENPIKDPTTGKVLSSNSIIAPAPAKNTASAASPPVPNARQAPDGFFYIPDPNRQGKYLKVVP